MVHVGEQKTPVTKRIYAPYDKKNQHDKCRHKERKHRDSSLCPAFCTCSCLRSAVHNHLLPCLSIVCVFTCTHSFHAVPSYADINFIGLLFTFRNQTADNTPDSGNRSMLPHIPSPL